LARCNSLAPFAARCGSAEGRLKGRDFILEAQATGVVAGAVVGGPVGAVVGGVAGAAVTAPGGPLSPGYCYVQNRRGRFIYDRSGQPLVRRCA